MELDYQVVAKAYKEFFKKLLGNDVIEMDVGPKGVEYMVQEEYKDKNIVFIASPKDKTLIKQVETNEHGRKEIFNITMQRGHNLRLNNKKVTTKEIELTAKHGFFEKGLSLGKHTTMYPYNGNFLGVRVSLVHAISYLLDSCSDPFVTLNFGSDGTNYFVGLAYIRPSDSPYMNTVVDRFDPRKVEIISGNKKPELPKELEDVSNIKVSL